MAATPKTAACINALFKRRQPDSNVYLGTLFAAGDVSSFRTVDKTLFGGCRWVYFKMSRAKTLAVTLRFSNDFFTSSDIITERGSAGAASRWSITVFTNVRKQSR